MKILMMMKKWVFRDGDAQPTKPPINTVVKVVNMASKEVSLGA